MQSASIPRKSIPNFSYTTRINAYCVMVLALSAALLYVCSSDVGLRADISSRLSRAGLIRPYVAPAADYSEQMKSDPALGLTLIHNAIGEKVKQAAGQNQPAYVVAYIGNCAGCSRMDFRYYTDMAKKLSVPLVLLTSASVDDTETFKRDIKKASDVDVTVVADPDQHVLKTLNPVFRPRAYLFDGQWRLQWLQTNAGLGYTPFTDDHFKDRLNTLRSVR